MKPEDIFNKRKAQYRVRYGEAVGWKSGSYQAVVKVPKERAGADLPEGNDLNAAFPDVHTFDFNPADFTGGYPQENQILVYGGQKYVITAAPPAEQMGDVTHTLIRTAYRQPASTDATVAPPGEADAGKRKTYAPPDITD